MSKRTELTNISLGDFINTVGTRAGRREDALALRAMMAEVTGQPPRMWGPGAMALVSTTTGMRRAGKVMRPPSHFHRERQTWWCTASNNQGQHAPAGETGQGQGQRRLRVIPRLADVDLALLREVTAMAYRHSTATDIASLQSQPDQTQGSRPD